MIYLDNAATSCPKPADCLHRALDRYLELGVSPGRGGYDRALEAADIVTEVRKKIGRFFRAGVDSQVCFAGNATDALNIMIQGLVKSGDHVVATRLEHNSVLRPLRHLERQGIISCDLVGFSEDGFIDPARLAASLRPTTRLVVMTHASNVLGTVQPVAEIGALCRSRGIPLIIDVAQSAGCIPIAMADWNVQGLAFTGHKSLLGPSGIGGLVLAPGLDPLPTRYGGTGVDSVNPFQPLTYPHRLEAGTLNLLGILGLDESLTLVEGHMAENFIREMQLTEKLRDGLSKIARIKLYAARNLKQNHLPILSCAVDGMASSDAGAILDGDYGIAVRTGLQCAPLVHEDLGSGEAGAIRFSLGPSTSEADIDAAIAAMTAIAA
ncbi:MAG: aminotransferase class V-fold PLP-dependent enzyme [Desulforhopalus sp.]|nr:aminotransferase class V-fold PLP-dependent enzyme [Desulforhopalus sp.]